MVLKILLSALAVFIGSIFQMDVLGAKWEQKPDIENGWNHQSTRPEPEVADDWKCEDDKPVTDIHWWGSYNDWREEKPPYAVESFEIEIREDIPADPNREKMPYSHPGDLVRRRWINKGDYTVKYAGKNRESGETEFAYTAFIEPPFGQKKGTIYWLGIYADQPPDSHKDNTWGWKQSLDQNLDDAVQGRTYDDGWQWLDLKDADGKSIDMAFVLTTDTPPKKKKQRPCIEHGMNFQSTFPQPLVADDWECPDGRPVLNVKWWGSYIGWMEPFPPYPVQAFNVGIWTDVPAGTDPDPNTEWSHPGELLYQEHIFAFSEDYAGSGVQDRVAKFKYSADLTNLFRQQKGKKYWLSIGALSPIPGLYPWGWGTSEDRSGAGAVQGMPWQELRDPWCNSTDMAFELTAVETGAIHGRVLLERTANPVEFIEFELRYPHTTTVVATYQPGNDLAVESPGTQILIGSDGSYDLVAVEPGVYDISAVASGYLRQVIHVVIVDPGNETTGVDFLLRSGDANRDNKVNVLDLNNVKINYGKSGDQ
jgi:hypothetical protein